jgi:hypothetical protein
MLGDRDRKASAVWLALTLTGTVLLGAVGIPSGSCLADECCPSGSATCEDCCAPDAGGDNLDRAPCSCRVGERPAVPVPKVPRRAIAVAWLAQVADRPRNYVTFTGPTAAIRMHRPPLSHLSPRLRC